MATFAERIRQLRQEHGLRQADLAEAAEVSRSAVAYWESGKSVPDTHTLGRLADHFGVSTDYLMGRTDYPEPKPMPFDPTASDWYEHPNCPSWLRSLRDEPDMARLLEDPALRALLVSPELLDMPADIYHGGDIPWHEIQRRLVRYLAFELQQARESAENDKT